jgi:hypothetical protein
MSERPLEEDDIYQKLFTGKYNSTWQVADQQNLHIQVHQRGNQANYT